jgi:aryl-alcohol dehydrogenase-like predicted oxidoreductase
LLDTGDFYGMGHNEMLLGEALKGGRRQRAFLAVKFGAMRGPDGVYAGFDARPLAVKNFLAYSLRRLKTDYVDLYQPARFDHTVPLEDTLGAIADLVQAGYVRNIGLSEVSAATLRRAAALNRIAALQIEYSLLSRDIEDAILPAARELSVPVVAYGVLSRRLISAATLREPAFGGDIRARMPRFSADNLRGAGQDRRGARRFRRATGLRLDARARGRHRAADRRAQPGATGGRSGRARADIKCR